MTNAQIHNVAIYGALGLVLVVAQWANQAIASGEVDWFVGPPAAQYKGLALALLGYVIPGLTLVIAAYRTRIGSEGVAAQVNDLREQGVPRSEMVVMSQEDAATTLGRQNGRPFVSHGEGGHAALLSTVPLRAGAMLNIEDARHLDGRPIMANEIVACDTCGARLTHVVGGATGWVAESSSGIVVEGSGLMTREPRR